MGGLACFYRGEALFGTADLERERTPAGLHFGDSIMRTINPRIYLLITNYPFEVG